MTRSARKIKKLSRKENAHKKITQKRRRRCETQRKAKKGKEQRAEKGKEQRKTKICTNGSRRFVFSERPAIIDLD